MGKNQYRGANELFATIFPNLVERAAQQNSRATVSLLRAPCSDLYNGIAGDPVQPQEFVLVCLNGYL